MLVETLLELKIGYGKSTGLRVGNCELTIDGNGHGWSFVFITVNISKVSLAIQGKGRRKSISHCEGSGDGRQPTYTNL